MEEDAHLDEPADELLEGRARGRLENLAHDQHAARTLAPLHVRPARQRRRVARPARTRTPGLRAPAPQ